MDYEENWWIPAANEDFTKKSFVIILLIKWNHTRHIKIQENLNALYVLYD